MAKVIDCTGGTLDLVLHRGNQRTFVARYKGADGNYVTSISSARMGFRRGKRPVLEGETAGAAFTGITVPVTVGSGTTMTFTFTEAQTRLLIEADTLARADFNYVLEAVLADGSILSVLKGDILTVVETAT